MNWLWHVLLGAAIGIIARLVHPGKENMGWIMTLFIGIVGSVAGRAIGDAVGLASWIVFIIAIVIAVILIAVYARIKGSRK